MSYHRLPLPARPHALWSRALLVLVGVVAAVTAAAQDTNIRFPVAQIEARLLRSPLVVLDMEQARPLIEGDRSARVLLAGADGDAPMGAKWKPVHAGAQGFNNEPRYEVAAYRLQKLFLDEHEYVVPPTVLRSKSLERHRELRSDARPTLRGTSSVLFLLAYWIEDVTNLDPFRPGLFETDAGYARHWGNLNILTHLIDHKDGNLGNILISTSPENRRVFSVDNDVAFGSRESDRGNPWSRLHVDRLPQRTIERLRRLSVEELHSALGVVAEFAIADGHLLAAELGPNLNPRRGVRVTDERVQLGLTIREIRDIENRIRRLLRRVDRGRIEAF